MRGRMVAALLLAAAFLLQSGCNLIPEEEAELTMPVNTPDEVTYTTQTVGRGDVVNKISGTCYVVSRRRYDLAFTDRGGYLAELAVSQGMDVEKGQTLASLDVDSLKVEIEKKKLAIEKLKVELEQTVDIEEEDNSYRIARLELQLESQNLGLENLKNQLREANDNHEEEVVLESLKTQINQQRLAIQQTMLELEEVSQEKEEKRNYSNEYKQIDLKVAQLELNDLYDAFSKAVITSPISGRVIFVDENLAVGDYVNAQKIFITVADTSDLLFEYTGSNAANIKMGMEATLNVDGKDYTATVVQTPSSVPAEEYEAYKDTVQFRIEEMPENLTTGRRANYEIILEEKKDVVVAPKNAITKYLGGYYASVMNEDGLRSERDVEVGIESATHYEILSGLEEGDVLIIE
ncbi:MAG: HlyD family efflux transporter periplasmic adaptor subunit [Oscillospiraceae bacterium]|nr:HlyD family efflux transporter periplasmic adaptor subunit [Oscillospiraceae bacterium]